MADSLASQIITAIGGPENVRSLTHCATRLRFELADASKVDQNALEHMKGVLGAVPQSGDRFQVVIGGGVATVYENIMHLPEMANAGAASASGEGQKSNADVKAEARSKARGKVAWLDSFFEYLADSFRPILGVLLGASIIIALVNLLISLNVIPNDEASAGWVFVKAIWKGVFYFLPIMVAYNAAKKLKVDPWLGGAIMAILMTPQFTSLMDAKTTTCVENAALGTKSCTANIFGIPMALSDYSGNVFVPLLMAAVLALVYHGLKKIIPESVQLVFVPFFCMIIVGALTAFIIGPIGVWVGNGLGVGLAWMNTHAPFIFAIIIPLLYPFLVPLGLHWPLNALMLMNIQTLGYDFIQARWACGTSLASAPPPACSSSPCVTRTRTCARPLSARSQPACLVVFPNRPCTASTCGTSWSTSACSWAAALVASSLPSSAGSSRPSPPPARPCMV